MNRNHLSHRAVISLTGSERCQFLQGLITNDVATLSPGAVCWAAMLNAQGRIQAPFFLWKDEETLFIEVASAHAEPLIKTLRRFRLRADVQIELTDHMVLTGPPDSPCPEAALLSTTDPRHPALGWRAILPAPLPDEAAGKADETALLHRRLRLGIPDDADIIPGQTLVLEANMDHLHGVSWEKGCYLGQEVTARTHYRGLIKKRILPVSSMDGSPLPDEGSLTLDGQTVGELRSHAGPHGLAQLHRQAWKKNGLMLGRQSLMLRWPDWLPDDTQSRDSDGTRTN